MKWKIKEKQTLKRSKIISDNHVVFMKWKLITVSWNVVGFITKQQTCIFNCWMIYLLCGNTFVMHMLSNEVMTRKDNLYNTEQHL